MEISTVEGIVALSFDGLIVILLSIIILLFIAVARRSQINDLHATKGVGVSLLSIIVALFNIISYGSKIVADLKYLQISVAQREMRTVNILAEAAGTVSVIALVLFILYHLLRQKHIFGLSDEKTLRAGVVASIVVMMIVLASHASFLTLEIITTYKGLDERYENIHYYGNISTDVLEILIFIGMAITAVVSYYNGGNVSDPSTKKSLALMMSAVVCVCCFYVIRSVLQILYFITKTLFADKIFFPTTIGLEVTFGVLTILSLFSIILIFGPLNPVHDQDFDTLSLAKSDALQRYDPGNRFYSTEYINTRNGL
ncbi:hypothetical protein AKO1_014799 [Acrasis kona]|uniref:Uncharacterized protein n=1 Tax=Acrasis kona TaxID=1008807 RepID=A0AAW2Z2C1_9EUKA